MKKKMIVAMLLVFTLLLVFIPLILNIPCIADVTAWYFKGLRATEYKTAYVSLIGGIIGVWMAVGTAIIIQDLFDRNMDREREKIVEVTIASYLIEEIKKNHNAMTTCDSPMHKHYSQKSTVLELAKKKAYKDLRRFNGDFAIDNWNKYAQSILDTDFNAYVVLSKIYECYKVVALFGNYTANTSKDFEKSGIIEYEKRYDKFIKRYGSLLQKSD